MENDSYRKVSVKEEGLPKKEMENYFVILENKRECQKFFNGNRFELATYEVPVEFWLEPIQSSPVDREEIEKIIEGKLPLNFNINDFKPFTNKIIDALLPYFSSSKEVLSFEEPVAPIK